MGCVAILRRMSAIAAFVSAMWRRKGSTMFYVSRSATHCIVLCNHATASARGNYRGVHPNAPAVT